MQAGPPSPPGSLDLAILKGYLSATSRAKLEAVDGWPSLDPSWQEAVVAAANYVWLLIDEIENAAPEPAPKRTQEVKDVRRGEAPKSTRDTRRQAKGYR